MSQKPNRQPRPSSQLLQSAISTYRNVNFLPYDPEAATPAHTGGVYDVSGRLIEQSIHYLTPTKTLFTSSLQLKEQPQDHWQGRFLYGGVYRAGFGHVLLESLARLWALDEIGAVDGVVFIVHENLRDPKAYIDQGLLGALLPNLPPIYVSKHAVRIDELVIPSQDSGFDALAAGSARFRAFFQKLGRGILPISNDKLYISRAGLNGARGRFLAEANLEDQLRHNGFTILRPETQTINNQIAYYKGANHILAADGAALHLAIPFAAQDANLCSISRRLPAANPMVRRTYLAQSQAYRGAPLDSLDCIAETWGRADLARLGFRDYPLLQYDKLSETLRTSGLLVGQNLRAPDPEIMAADKAKIAALIGAPLVRHWPE